MTALQKLEKIVRELDERRAEECLARLRPSTEEWLKLDRSEQDFWLSIFPWETDLEELEEWEQGTGSDIALIDA